MMKMVKNTSEKSEALRSDGHMIIVDLSRCISAGPCSIAAPLTFLLRDSDGKAIINDPDGDSMEKIMEAARSCPVLAITIKKNNTQLFP